MTKDWLIAALVYVPAFLLGKAFAERYGFDPFLIGWIVSGISIGLRYEGPDCIRASAFKQAR